MFFVAGCHASGSGGGVTYDLATSPSLDLGGDAVDGAVGDLAGGAAPHWVQQSISGFNVGSFSSLWGTSANDVWAVGTDGFGNASGYAYHSAGGGVWTASKSTGPLYAVWGSSASDVYLAGVNLVLHSTNAGATWSTDKLPSVAGSWLIDSLWGSGANDIYAAGFSTDAGGTKVGSSILHSTGNGTWVAQYSDGSGDSFSLWGADATHLFAVDRQTGAVVRSSGDGNWTAYGALGPSGSIWGLGAGQLYVTGSGGSLFQSADAKNWTPHVVDGGAGEQLEAVFGTSADELFVVGAEGSIFRGSGGSWTKEGTAGTKLRAIWGAGGDLWAAGADGVYHRQ